MKNDNPPIISALELMFMREIENLILVDASSGPTAYSNFQKSHLKGARYVDLNTQLADIQSDLSQGGRHPLPKVEHFAQVLGDLGIGPESHVIVYDSKNGSNAAARFWWMLKALGHQKIQVLNGGISEAEKIGFPCVDFTEPILKVKAYPAYKWLLPLADLTEVAAISQNPDYCVIDVRDSARYRGEVEPIDLVAGHIPGAINFPFTENLDESGLFLSAEDLRKKYSKLFQSIKIENRIVHCGSGVTACHTLLALAHAQLPISKLYVGSWSEWSRNQH